MSRAYHQYCPVAHSLDLVGERWALLIVRDLLGGPKRYSDLLEGLGGISTNILASRLRDLERGGVIRKTKLPPPAASTVYELTSYGAELEEVVNALARWGARSLGSPERSAALPHGWLENAIRATFDPASAVGPDASYEVRAGGERAKLRISDGKLARAADDEPVDAIVEADPPTLFDLIAGELDPDEALADGRLRVRGDHAELERFLSLFSFARRDAAPAS